MLIAKDKVVSIDYTLTDRNGNLLDGTAGGEPLDYLHGYQNIISGLENALEGKMAGDSFQAEIPASEAYGEVDERLIIDLPRERFGDIDSLAEGMRLRADTQDGSRLFTVTGIGDGTVTIDGNHPLAGVDLCFDVMVAAVRDASEEELRLGFAQAGKRDCCGGGDCGGDCGEDCGCGGDCAGDEGCGHDHCGGGHGCGGH